ncbi:MAG TPA: hypothetical protein VJS69_04460 [Candidatus Krumholzibacteria bacterium]|nr:hypothetical protein [Candidatus Krumholzibacteria bacterium]
MKFAVALVVLLTVLTALAPGAHAQEFHRNAYGMYIAPGMYGIAKGTDYQFATTGGGLDVGIYYARAFTASFSTRLEVKYGTKSLDDVELSQPYGYVPFRLSESIVEVPLVLQGDRRVPVGDHEIRISVGGGASYKYVTNQKLLIASGRIEDFHLHPADSYQKFALLLDGGTTFNVDKQSAVFLRFRYDIDITTFGKPADAEVFRELWSAGFYAGFEYGI